MLCSRNKTPGLIGSLNLLSNCGLAPDFDGDLDGDLEGDLEGDFDLDELTTACDILSVVDLDRWWSTLGDETDLFVCRIGRSVCSCESIAYR